MMKKKLIYITLITAAMSFASCEKLVTVAPQNTVTPDVALKDVNGYLSVLTAIYDYLQSYGYYGRDMMLMGDVLADNIVVNANLSGNRYLTNNSNAAGATYAIWTTNYFAINECNIIIDGLPKLTNVLASQVALQNQIMAQAYALRGLLYFDIARVYGWEPNNVPSSGFDNGFAFSAVLRTTPVVDLASEDIRNRSTNVDTYKQIEADFLKAISIFQLIGTVKPSAPYAFSECAAHGWLAKVYLYEKDYTDCVTQCQAALNPAITPVTLVPITAGGYSAAFNKVPNPESLMEINFVQNIEVTGVTGSNNAPYTYTQPTGYGFGGINTSTTPNTTNPGVLNNVSTFGGQLVSAELLASFDTPTDDRKLMFFTSRTSSDATNRLWCNKYNGHSGPYTDNMPILRYADVILMEAEGLAAQGGANLVTAQGLVQQLRTARNASTAAVPADAINLPIFIQAERRRELFFEGQRFFDLKRTASGITKPAATGFTALLANDYRLIAPIPTAEVTFNPSLPKNPNY